MTNVNDFTNDNHPALDDPNYFIFYRYAPTLAGAIIFTVLFTISTALHLWQTLRARTWFFIPIIVGGIFEIIGYVARIFSSHDQWRLTPFAIQAVMLLIAPTLFAASIYMTLGRIILLVDGEKYSLISKRWLTRTFVIGDIIAFLTQTAGAGIENGNTKQDLNIGQDVIIVGLFLQCASFMIFVTVGLIWHRRILQNPTPLSSPESAIHWKKYLYVLYTASALILVRSIFRIIEYIMGNDGYLMRHEVFLYVFDSVMMLGVVVIFNIVHPAEFMAIMRGRSQGSPGDDTPPSMSDEPQQVFATKESSQA